MDPKIKIKTGLSDTTLRKPSRPVTRPEPNSPTPTRLSLDRSPANPRSRKAPTSPEASLSKRTHTKGVIGSSESQTRLAQLKEDLRKANELIASLESEKALALDEADEQTLEALEAQKLAEENYEIEKFKALEAGVEAAQLKKELEVVKSQHASDSAVLLLVTRSLEKTTRELEKANEDKKNMLWRQAENASKMLAVHGKKVDVTNKEIASLKSQLDEKARRFEAEVKRRDKIIERLDGEIEVLKMEKSYAHGSAEEWCNKAIAFERCLNEANVAKRSASDSVASLTKELEDCNKRLSEMSDLVDKARVTATVRRRQCQDLGKLLSKAEKEARELKAELVTVKEEKSGISSELERSKEKLLSLGGGDYETQVEDYKKMLDEARREIDVLVGEVEQTKMRESGLVDHVKKFDEEVCSMGKEMSRLGGLVKRTEEEADVALKRESRMRDDLKEVEDEVICLQETLREARAESLRLNAKMLDKETEFQSVIHENDLLRVKQDDSVKKIKELEEALAKKDTEEDDGELSETEQDYDLVETLEDMNVKLEENREDKEDSTDGNDDDAVEVEYSMCESYQTGKKEDFHKGK